MAHQLAATAMTLNDLDGHSPAAGCSNCNLLNICAAFYTMSTDSVLTQLLCISRASCLALVVEPRHFQYVSVLRLS